jgi:hypothetical protein
LHIFPWEGSRTRPWDAARPPLSAMLPSSYLGSLRCRLTGKMGASNNPCNNNDVTSPTKETAVGRVATDSSCDGTVVGISSYQLMSSNIAPSEPTSTAAANRLSQRAAKNIFLDWDRGLRAKIAPTTRKCRLALR